MPHLNAAFHVAVDELHHLARIETVFLSEVDEQSAVAFLCLPATTLAALLAVFLSLAALFLACLDAYLGRVGIVGEELSELHADNLLYQVVLVDELKVAADVLHERRYLLLIDIGLHYLVHHLIQLLLAYLLRCGHLACHKLLAQLALHLAYLALLTGVNDGYARAFLARAACTSRTVDIILNVVGHSVVDDMREVVNVKTARSHVGGHEQLRQMLAELLHREVALLLREVSVQRLRVVTVLYQFVGYILSLHLCAAEYDGEDARMEVHYSLQREILVLCAHHVVYVVHVLCALVAASHHNFLRVVQVGSRYLLYLLAHRGGEEQRVAFLWHTRQNGVHVLGETHVEHLVGLVEHHVAHGSEFRHAAVHQVDESSRRCHYDVHTLLQLAYLRLDACPSIHRYDVNVGDILRKVLQVVGNLQAQLARRREHNGLSLLYSRVNALQQGYAEGGGLARSCLRQCNDIVTCS